MHVELSACQCELSDSATGELGICVQLQSLGATVMPDLDVNSEWRLQEVGAQVVPIKVAPADEGSQYQLHLGGFVSPELKEVREVPETLVPLWQHTLTAAMRGKVQAGGAEAEWKSETVPQAAKTRMVVVKELIARTDALLPTAGSATIRLWRAMVDDVSDGSSDYQQLQFMVSGGQGEGAEAVWCGPDEPLPDHVGVVIRSSIWRPKQSIFVFEGQESRQRFWASAVANVHA
eukprot:TRINITY_DN11659_c0_g1_i4.p1 TRINITY_DN11659_c0_g1~~TRINITY_DN11659_c0_g1_i4.p1  ORF type:complete len:233 (-),score=40.92 TRINITY_DN11659_c0_g1_i4:238-936(-)